MPPPVVTPDKVVHRLDRRTEEVIRYNIGEGNWASTAPWVPNLARPGQRITLSDDQVIDIVILGDGYLTRSEFRLQLVAWIDDFFELEVYRQFAGAFRIRALFTKSNARCDLNNRNSYYRVKADDDGVDRQPEWFNDTGAANDTFRELVRLSLGRFILNQASYPPNLLVGGNPVIHNEVAGLKSHLVPVMLVHTQTVPNVKGMTRTIDSLHLNIAFGSQSIHEFGHAFAYLEDEYIETRGSIARRTNPLTKSVFTLSNLTFSPRLSGQLWVHLSSWGKFRRTASGSDPCPVVGWLWRGGEEDLNVWHSEYHCLMNGRDHENYAYSPLEGDNTKNTDLRFRDPIMFCLWCQELVTIRIWEKTGQMARPEDPFDINQKGLVWYERWVNELRTFYWNFFDVEDQIQEREKVYANPQLYSTTFNELLDSSGNYRPVDGSLLYQPFVAQETPVPPQPPIFLDDEELMMANA